jgi:tetratricopeptide (TPR) repeat protein
LLRVRFLAERRGADSKATVLTLTGASFEAQGQYAKAQEQYERALTLDPLRLDLHQRYSKLLRQEDARKRREAKEPSGALRPAAVPPGARG